MGTKIKEFKDSNTGFISLSGVTVHRLGNRVTKESSTRFSHVEFKTSNGEIASVDNVIVPSTMLLELGATGDFYFNYGIETGKAGNMLLASSIDNEKRAHPHFYVFVTSLFLLLMILSVVGIAIVLADWLFAYLRYQKQKRHLAEIGFDEESCITYG